MRILHITSARHFTGTERHMVDLCRGLFSRGHDVYIAIRPTCEWQTRLDFVPAQNVRRLSIRHSFGVLSAMRIAEFARDNNVDVIHAHVARDYVPASIACMAAKNARFVLTRHMLGTLKPFNRFALKNLSRAIGVSESVGAELRSVFPEKKVVVIQNGLDLGHLRDREALRDEFRSLHDIGPDVPIVGALGELREAKGQRDLVLAASEVLKRIPNCVFVVTGLDNTVDRSFRRELRRLTRVLGIAEQFLWLDWLDDTAPFYAAADLFVSPSHSESFGLAILEAMIRRTPVVATDTAGARELLGPEEPLVPVRDPVALAEAIYRSLNDPNLGGRGEMLQARAAEKFSLDRMLDETEKAYRDVCSVG